MRFIATKAMLFLASTFGLATDGGGDAALALRGLDAVLLCEGREVEGSTELVLDRHGYRYLFSSSETRAAFESDPERFEIQMGGGCGRMGPLSGKGRPDRFAVHDGRVYIFASEQCRNGFLSRPEEFVDRAAPARPARSDPQAVELLDQVIERHGGQTLRDLEGWSFALERDQQSGGTDYHVVDERSWSFPEGFRQSVSYNEQTWVQVVNATGGFDVEDGEHQPMHPASAAALRDRGLRSLVPALKAALDPGAVVTWEGSDEESGIDRIVVWTNGWPTTLHVEQDTATVSALSYVGRPVMGEIGEVEVQYGDFRSIGGLLLPGSQQATFRGKPVESLSGAYSRASVNPEYTPGAFGPEDR